PTSAWPANAAPADLISPGRKRIGRALMAAATLGLLAVIAVQILYKTEVNTIGFETWRPVVYAYVLWGIALGVGQVLTRGE
ncbi:MAG: sugar ABC transporter permease, partial [Mesorhizobium sp.]